MANINSKVKSATKWSAVTEIAAKLVSPISTIILARALTPDAFGILVTATMVISFAEIFTDAGFQKYLIQHEFDDEKSLRESTTVAFWTNLIVSFLIWGGIIIFSNQIAELVGNKGYGIVIAVSCLCVPIEAFSSIQMAIFKRAMDFKTLFFVRIIGICIPLIITIPLALTTHSYWSLIMGMIALNICNAIILTYKSHWRPKWYYKISLLKEMLSFSLWSMVESISIWITGYIDIFFVGTILSTYYMGIYRTGINSVNQIMAIITTATTPVLFSALSRLQNNEKEFKDTFLKFQKNVSLLVLPLGVGIYTFRDLVTEILLGSQWTEASDLIGWWGLTSSITIVLSHYCSEVYRAKGLPKLSFTAQLIHLCFLIPTVLISIRYGFHVLCLSRSLIRFTAIIINLIITFILIRISFIDILRNILPSLLGAFPIFLLAEILPSTQSVAIGILYACICAILYIAIISLFKDERYLLLHIKDIFKT